MTLERSFQNLIGHLQQVQEVVGNLRITIVEDRPRPADIALVDPFDDGVEDMCGWLAESLAALTDSRFAAVRYNDIPWAGRVLAGCQGQINQLEIRYCDLVSHNRLTPLLQEGQTRGGEWPAWTASVQAALHDCQPPLVDVKQALLLCWQDIAERASLSTIAVQNTAVGRQVLLPAAPTK